MVDPGLRRCCLVVPIVAVAMLVPDLANAGDWETDYRSKELRVQTRTIEGSGIEEIRGYFDVAWTPKQTAEVIFSTKAQKRYLVGVKEVKVLGEVTTGSGKQVKTVYQRMEYPAIDDREVVLKFTMSSKESKAGPVWTIRFSRVNAKLPERDGVVRIQELTGSWVVMPHPSGSGTRLVYKCHVEIGGNVPDFVVNSGQVDNLRDMMKTLRAEIEKKHGAP